MKEDSALGEKLMTPAQAVERFIEDGCQLTLGGFTVSRNPMTLAREIIRQGKKDLHLVCHSHGQAMDLLIGAGAVSRLELAYGGTGRFAPTSIRFRRAVERGEILLEDYSNYQMSLRFLAGSLGVPFMANKSGLETDLVGRDGFPAGIRGKGKVAAKKLTIIDNPFAPPGDKVILLPALNPDVALLHVQKVGDDGTVRIDGLTFADLEQCRAAERVIVSCEEIVPAAHLRADPDKNSLPGFVVDAVVPAPWGAHPTACHFHYDYDPRHLRMYGKMARDDGAFKKYLQEWVLDLDSQEAYLTKVGVPDLLAIRANSVLGYAPGLDRR